MRLYLIRHGRTEPSGTDSSQWPLSEQGEGEARVLAEASFWPEVVALYSSPEPKALATVRPSAEKRGLTVQDDVRLREVRRPPAWIDDYLGAVRAYLNETDDSPDGWERPWQVRKRMLGCIQDLERRHGDASVAVCGHGLAVTLYLCAITGLSSDRFDVWRSIGFGEVAVVEDGRLVVPFGDPVGVSG